MKPEHNRLKKQAVLTLRLFTKFFLLVLLSGLFFACKDDKKTEPEKKPGPAALVPVTSWQSFKLTAAMINGNAELALDRNMQLILKQYLKGVNGNAADAGLYAYPSAGHANHGRNQNPISLDPDAMKALGNTLIIGNNYVNWNAVCQIIYTVVGPDRGQLLPDFRYILFEPMDSGRAGCANCAGHLWYKIRYFFEDAATKKIKEITPGGGGGTDSSNPSPPAVPGP